MLETTWQVFHVVMGFMRHAYNNGLIAYNNKGNHQTCPNCRQVIDVQTLSDARIYEEEPTADDMILNTPGPNINTPIIITLRNSERPTTKRSFIELLDLERNVIGRLLRSAKSHV